MYLLVSLDRMGWKKECSLAGSIVIKQKKKKKPIATDCILVLVYFSYFVYLIEV